MNSQPINRKQYGLKLNVVEKGKRPSHISNNEEFIELGSEIIFNLSNLDTYHYDGWKPVHYDLLVVCAAVAVADRQRARKSTQWSRPFNISIPVRELEIWNQPTIKNLLCDALRHLTGDAWSFSFFKATDAAEKNVSQRPLPFDNKEFVIAYSDGLDSRCVSGLVDTNDTSAVRVRVSKTKDRKKKEESPFDLIPFDIKPRRTAESSFRSRGFIFASVTAIASHISGINRIIVPESGQGALGPALLPLHNIYVDYRCHPTFFRKMESFIKELLEYVVVYEQPRLWFTKGETIKAFLTQPDKDQKLVKNTRSCWQKRFNVRVDGRLTQCGLCAACLLRRMSMHAAGVIESADTYTFDLTKSSYLESIRTPNRTRTSNIMVEYGSVGARHFQQLADMAKQPTSDLRPHIFQISKATGLSEQETNEKLKRFLMQHAEEWYSFVRSQGQDSFINRWTVGGRYD